MRKSRGFSLIEMMVTVAIVGILAAIAYPSYRTYVLRTQRAVAKTAMAEVVARQEGYFVDRKRYATTLSALGYAAATLYLTTDGALSATNSDSSIYSLNLAGNSASCPASGSATAMAYSIVATPLNGQTQDKNCMSLCLTASGIKSASGNSTTRCWKS